MDQDGAQKSFFKGAEQPVRGGGDEDAFILMVSTDSDPLSFSSQPHHAD